MGAPLNPVPGVLKAFFEGYVDGLDVYKWGNVLHFAYTGGPPSDADCATIAGTFRNAWNTDMGPECPSPTTLQSVTVTDLTSVSSGEGQSLTVASGSRGDDSIPANAAVLISYPSTTRYKGGHPRSYLLAGGNADLNGAAEWSSAFVTEVQTHWRSMLTACLAATSGTTAVSSFGFVRYHGKYLPNSGAPHYYLDTPIYSAVAVSTATARAEMASQRRRIGRRKA